MISLEEYLKKIKEETGISDKFINEAKPRLEFLFAEVSGDILENTLKDITEIFYNQAETEKLTIQIKKDLEKLEETEKEFGCALKDMKVEANKLSNTIEDSKLIIKAMKNKTKIEA